MTGLSSGTHRRRPIRWMALAAMLAGSICAAATPVARRDMAGVDNYSEIAGSSTFAGDRVGFGGATDAAAMGALREAGYVTVISLREGTEEGVDHAASRAAAERAGLEYVELPFSAEDSPPSQLEAVLQQMSESGRQPVYLHCGSATRAAAIWMIGRVNRDGLSRQQAAEEAREIAGKPDAAVDFANQYLDAHSR